MDFLEKIHKVKEKLAFHQEHQGETIDYFVNDLVYVNELEGDPNYGEERVYLEKSEHLAIINYLADTLYLDILEDKGHHLKISILPATEPRIKPKSLELIARELKDYHTGTDIVSLLTECGVDKRLIIYPNSKWLVFYNVFNELNYHRNPKDKTLLFKIICEAIHPLNLGGNQELSNELARKLNQFLEYDELNIAYNEKEKVYKIYEELPEEIEQEMQQEEYEKAEKQSLFLSQPENVEKISLLRKSFQTFLNVIELFCADPSHPTTELNDAYTNLNRQINKIISELKLEEWTLNDYHLYEYHSPFTNLFGAEKHYRDFAMELSWEAIRPKMNAAYGQIEDIYRDVNGSDILNDAEAQKKLGDIQVYLTELKTKQDEEKRRNKPMPIERKPIPIQIVGETNVKLTNTTHKESDKNKFPFKLPAGTKWEDIIFQFLDQEKVFIKIKRLEHHTDFKDMGFIGRGKNPKPSEIWAFLNVLAKVGGELAINDPAAKDVYKKQKELLSKALQNYFALEYDPFYPYHESLEKTGNSYKIKMTLIPHTDEEDNEMPNEEDALGIKEYLKEQAPTVYEDE